MINDELLYRVATAYHIDKKNQREIALDLAVSRVQVSKYLKMAEARGLVKVEIIPPAIGSEELLRFKAKYKKHFGLRDILVCPSYNAQDALFRSLFKQAGDYLFANYGPREMIVGIGWGRTTYEFTEHMSPVDRSQWRIVPLAGGSNRASKKYFNTNHLVHALSEKLHAQSQLLYLPLISYSKAGRRSISVGDEYGQIVKLWDTLDLIICSVGSDITGSPLFTNAVIGLDYLRKLSRSHAVGDMLTHFYDLQGNIIEIGLGDRMINVSLDQLMKANNRLVIVSGIQKADAILGALRAHLVDILIIDQATAVQVLDNNKRK
jgi:DNA-binding transcriptional regulator LsrR (DeoR family)